MTKAAEANSSDNINFVFIMLSRYNRSGLAPRTRTGLMMIKCQKRQVRKED